MKLDESSFLHEMEKLIKRAQDGDPEATAALYLLYEDELIEEVRRKLGSALRNRMDSVDLVQSLWVDVLQDFKKFEYRGPDSFHRWLTACLSNKIQEKARYYRAAKRDPKKAVRIRSEDTQSVGVPLPAAPDPTPSHEAIDRESIERLMRILDGFDDLQRKILILRFGDQKKYKEIGRIVGKSADAVRKLCGKGLAELKKRMDTTSFSQT